MWHLKMENIRFLPNYVIEIELTDNVVIEYDMKVNLNKGRFVALKDEEFFKTGKLKENCCIEWDSLTFIHDYEIFRYRSKE